MAARAAMMPSQERPTRDPSIRLQRSASQRSRPNSFALKDDSLRPVGGMQAADFSSLSGNPAPTSPLAQSFEMSQSASHGPFQDDYTDISGPAGSQYGDGGIRRSSSSASISRSNTLRKQKSLSRRSSLRRSNSKRSIRAGSIGGITYDDTTGVDKRSVYYTPIPTSGAPTDILANRFQGWRKFLKDLINYFREVQSSYENRAKQLIKVSNAIGAVSLPFGFLGEGGLGDALQILKNHQKEAIAETAKAREIEDDVISQLSILRSDLGQKIKEIKSLSGDFKNAIEKEKESTKKIVGTLQEALAAVDSDAKAMIGKDDPYIVRLSVERQVERQIDEENFLHRAYLNLEGSGRELEAIVVGEIQKALNAFATILKKEGDDSYGTAEKLQNGPISMPKDLEWSEFIFKDPHFVTPDTPLRRAQDLEYPGKHHPAAAEVRAGMLERKSKYLKSYTPGWFVLSPTHLHEFKSADGVYTQAPAMSLYLPDQRLGAHSQPSSSSQKFILKGRQTGGMHRGHSWVFRAETYDTMLAWYDDIKNLTEKTGEERNRFVRGHSRSFSSRSAASTSSFEDDEADRIPYSTEAAAALHRTTSATSSTGAIYPEEERPQPGGRFPSDVQIRRDLPVRLSGSSDGSEVEQNPATISGGSNGRVVPRGDRGLLEQERGTLQSTPMDQKSLKDLEGVLFITQNDSPKRDMLSEKAISAEPIEPTSVQETTQPLISDPHRSPEDQKAAIGAMKVNTSTAMSPALNHSTEDDKAPTSPETPISIPTKADEADGFRVYQSPGRPVKASTQEAASYAHQSASIESYNSQPSQPLQQSQISQPSATDKVVFLPSSMSNEQVKPSSVAVNADMDDESAPHSPGISRKNTDASVSNFHVPGSFPRTTGMSIA